MKRGLFSYIFVSLASMAAVVLVLGATHALAFTPSDLLSGIGQIKRSTWDNLTRGFALWVLPQGHGWGLDADTVDGFHAASFALQRDFLSFSSLTLGQLSSLNQEISSLDTSLATGELASFFQNASNLVSGTLSDSRLSSNVALLNNSQTFTGAKTFNSPSTFNSSSTFTGGLTVSGGSLTVSSFTSSGVVTNTAAGVLGTLPGTTTTVLHGNASGLPSFSSIVNADVSSTAAISYSKLNLSGSIVGNDLSPSIAITTSGAISASGGVSSSSSLTTTGTGTLSVAGAGTLSSTLSVAGAGTFSSSFSVLGASTLSSTLAVSGASTLAGTTVGNLTSTTGNLTSTVPDSSSAIAFNLATGTTYATAGANLLVLKNNTTTELSLDKNGNLTVNGNLIATGTLQGTQLISTVATGTAPLVVSSTTVVPNLHAASADQPQPNLVLNSDFSRRNKWMTFMPETFTDTSGWTAVAGTLGSVVSNTLTAGSTGTWMASAGLSTWKDARFSAQWQLTANSTTDNGGVARLVDVNNLVDAHLTAGTVNAFMIWKRVAGTWTQVASASYTATLNNWYWSEIEFQGTTVIAKLYSSGASPVAKSSATLVATITGTVSDSAVQSGYVGLYSSSGTASKWGGLASGDGGVYVEGWGPESWNPVFTGTLGGQAVGFDESTSAGPIGKQWALRAYIPATSRGIRINNSSLANGAGVGTGFIAPSTTYAASFYEKVSGLGGSGALVGFEEATSDTGGNPITYTVLGTDSGENSWARKTTSVTTDSTAVGVNMWLTFNHIVSTSSQRTATGTAFVMLPQIEQGAIATPWRNAPADDGPIVWNLYYTQALNISFNTCSYTNPIDQRDLAANIFLPWDGTLNYAGSGQGAVNTAQATGSIRLNGILDGANIAPFGFGNADTYFGTNTLGYFSQLAFVFPKATSAGKHRVGLGACTTGGQSTLEYAPPLVLQITATRGK